VEIDATLDAAIETIGPLAAAAESAGYDGVWAAEVSRDPFLPLVVAAQQTATVRLGTSIAVAFARNPLTLATVGNDLQRASAGRFVLGLGSQIQPHIEKRFSMPWSHPAPRMRELILAIRAIWRCWNEDEALDFRGEFYRHTLMTPFFSPGRNEFGPPPIYLSAPAG
jgi:probable F420-dependent oxidoreductase